MKKTVSAAHVHILSLRALTRVMVILLLGVLLLSTPAANAAAVHPEPDTVYGIPCKVSQLRKGVIERDQNLSRILLAHNVSHAVIDAVARKSRNVFDLRRLRVGNPYCIIPSQKSPAMARYFVYEQTPVDYVVFGLKDPVEVYRGRKTVEVQIHRSAGTIETSLHQTLAKQHLPRDLASRLADLYAWTIDFHHLQKGDRFTLVYEKKFVDGKAIGTGKIHAARFNHRGRDYDAYYFEHDGVGRYYDDKARSLQKAFLKAPLKYSRITSRFSPKRLHPITKTYRPHLGIDYAAPAGTPIMSVGDGVVTEARYNKECGRYIKVRHNLTYSTQYLHMSGFAKGIAVGQKVQQGEVIGFVGSTGFATGPHLDYRTWKNGHLVDPNSIDIPPATPLKAECYPWLYEKIRAVRQFLDSTPSAGIEQAIQTLPQSHDGCPAG